MSEIGKAIDAVIRGGLAPLMKREGFKKFGRNFLDVSSESVAVLNVQASTSNHGATGKFTINLGRHFPSVARAAGEPELQGPPKEYDCTVRLRIGHLLPEKLDYWWMVGPETNIEQLALDVARVVEDVGLPWLRRMHDLHALKHRARRVPIY